MVDLEWNRKTIFEKLDWLKETLEDLIAKANQNIAFHREQLETIVVRLSGLEKLARKSTPAKKATPAKKSAPTKKSQAAPLRRTKRKPSLKGKR